MTAKKRKVEKKIRRKQEREYKNTETEFIKSKQNF
jgi:hypothetical protein